MTRPWHQRVAAVAHLRARARRLFFSSLASALAADDGRAIMAGASRGLAAPALPRPTPPPYPDLVALRARPAPAPVFITARFRSGSTLLWHIFRHAKGCTSYYEPHNQRRWFDPSTRGTTVDATHRGVADYWREYDGLDHLGRWFDERWATTQLYMDAACTDGRQRAYLDALIKAAPGVPVLQCNHVDFRLPWIRQQFPRARVIHVYRHPRDQWMSTLLRPASVPRDVRTADFVAHDHFYLLPWAHDLKYQFPCLDPEREVSPYRLFYLLWRLSHAYGTALADWSVPFEALVAAPRPTIERLLQESGLRGDIDRLAALVGPATSGAWRHWAPEAWFREHEQACEEILGDEVFRPGRDEAPRALRSG